MKKLYEESSVQNIADKIRDSLNIKDKMKIADMPDYIGELAKQGINIRPSHLDEDGEWQRPPEYEDLSQLTLNPDIDEVYLSMYNFDNELWHLGLMCTVSGGYKVELGHVVNGQFIVQDTTLLDTNAYYRVMLPANETTLVARVTAQNPAKFFTAWRFANITTAISGKAIAVPYYLQPVVERVGNLGSLTALTSSSTTYGYGASYIERDAVNVGYRGSIVTSIALAWDQCWNLQRLEIENWDTSKWKLSSTGFTYVWRYCYSLRKLDLSKWNTDLWTITSLAYVWTSCYSLIELDVSTWNTTSWKPTTMVQTWYNCQSLKQLDLSNWNVSSWVITNLNNTWGNCFSLEKVTIEDWNTTNWKLTTLASAWTNCYNLKKLDLSKWVTSNWVVATTGFASTWSGCHALNYLDVSTWDTSKWTINSIQYAWYNCVSLKELILPWDTSSWTITTISYTWANCHSLSNLDISTWTTNNWAVTTSSFAFAYCRSLQRLDLSTWNTSNWKVTTMERMFGECFQLEEIDLSTWNTSQFAITTMRYFCDGCYKLRKLDVSSIVDSSTTYPLVPNSGNQLLRDFYPPIKNNQIAQNYANSLNLSRESLLRILNALPTLTSAKTLTLTNLRAKLTTADLAIATQKGWTVA